MSIDLQKILVIGGSGMVGSQVPFGIKPRRAQLDITDRDSIERSIKLFSPSAILMLAALVDMAGAERDPKLAERVNVEGAANVAEAAARAGVPLLYLSTCAVFDGKKVMPYVESDTPSPLNVYGDTKYRGEKEVLARAPHALVVRTGWLFGGFKQDKKFIRRFYDSLRAGKPVRATADRFGSPTYIPDLVAKLPSLLQEDKQGILHVINKGVASYFEIAENIRDLLHSPAEVTGAPASELDSAGVRRGKMEGLASERGGALRPYQEALREYIMALEHTES